MSQEPKKSTGEQIGNIVRSALQSGDLSRLKDLGPAVQDVVKDVSGTIAQAASGVGANNKGQNQPAGQPDAPPRPAWQGSAAPGGSPNKKSAGSRYGVGTFVLGIVGMSLFGLMGIIFGILSFIPAVGTAFGVAGGMFGAFFAVSAGATVVGQRRRRLGKRVQAYYALLREKPVFTFDEVAERVGWPPAKVRKDVRKAIDKKLMPDVRLDKDETCMMLGEEAYKRYLESEKTRRQREAEQAESSKRLANPETAEMEKFRQEGRTTLAKIRQANKAIAGEEVSEKLTRLETTTGKIFTYVDKHPGKLPDTRKFMSYYLPTTLKLVDKYRQYEEMEVQPANVKEAKKEIEGTLDTIDTAFNHLLEGLYQEDTLDVSTDIDVLKQMLEQEGLTGKKFEVDTEQEDGTVLKL